MRNKVKTIAGKSQSEFDREINSFINQEHVLLKSITFNDLVMPTVGGNRLAFIAHIEYTDTRKRVDRDV